MKNRKQKKIKKEVRLNFSDLCAVKKVRCPDFGCNLEFKVKNPKKEEIGSFYQFPCSCKTIFTIFYDVDLYPNIKAK
jgi:hypothetical protein